jgi:hypothetical protein
MLGLRNLTVKIGGAAKTSMRDNGLQVSLMIEWESAVGRDSVTAVCRWRR